MNQPLLVQSSSLMRCASSFAITCTDTQRPLHHGPPLQHTSSGMLFLSSIAFFACSHILRPCPVLHPYCAACSSAAMSVRQCGGDVSHLVCCWEPLVQAEPVCAHLGTGNGSMENRVSHEAEASRTHCGQLHEAHFRNKLLADVALARSGWTSNHYRRGLHVS